VMMSDRRGPTGRPVNPKYVPYMHETGRGFYAWLGIDVPDVYPGAPGVVSSLGRPDKGGAIEGSFARTADWPEVAEGVRGFVTLLGDHESGPVVITLAAESGAEILPSATFHTEVALIVVRGTARTAGNELGTATMRIVEAGQPMAPVIADPSASGLAVILGDRRKTTTSSDGWLAGVSEIVGELCSKLDSVPEPARRV
jgi:hypothetical protein